MMRRVQRLPRRLVLMATSLALTVPVALRLLLWTTGKGPFGARPPMPAPMDWLRMYRQSRSLRSRWLAGYGIAEESAAWRTLRGATAGEHDLVPFPPSDDELMEILGGFASSVKPNGLGGLLGSPEGQFMFQVAIPCVVLYREPPGRLLHRARHGDDDAFEKLLLLDKSVIADPVLFRRWHDLANDRKPSARRRFREALAGFPKNRVDAKSVRVAFAGLLSAMAEREGFKLTGPEIRDWFGMFQLENLTDQDMPGGEALTKAIQRHRDWPISREKDSEAGQ